MKRIGLLGGMSWESSAEYYRLINEAVRDRLGGLHSADCLLRSVDFADIEALQRDGRWDEAAVSLAAEARALVAGGAELLVLCTNTMHKVADRLASAVDIPFVHIADTTANAVRAQGLCVGTIDDNSRDEYRRIMAGLAGRGAQGILLGCTEIDLLVGPTDATVPVFDTTRLHAERAVELALAA
jgi:aspartate racemase